MQNTQTWEEFQLKRKNDAIRWLLVALLAFTAIAGVILASILLPSCVAFAGEIPEETAIHCILGESRLDYVRGDHETFLAHAEALRNRGTTQGVYGCKAKWGRSTEKYAQDANYCQIKGLYVAARQAWRDSEHTNITNGATHWEGKDFKDPYWVKGMILVKETKRTKFYKEKI